jgi:hypothetical protein
MGQQVRIDGAARVFLVVAIAVAVLSSSPARAAGPCNGSAALCDKAYNAVAYAGTHDAFASMAYLTTYQAMVPLMGMNTWIAFADQARTVTQQLEDGVRFLDLRLVPDRNGAYHLCHAQGSTCSSDEEIMSLLSSRPAGLADDIGMPFSSVPAVFVEIALFMLAHPNEVVTLYFQVKLNDAATAAYSTPGHPATREDVLERLLQATTLNKIGRHRHEPGTKWATLGEMIAANQRLVIFVDGTSGTKGGGAVGSIHEYNRYFRTMSNGWKNTQTIFQVAQACGEPTAVPDTDVAALKDPKDPDKAITKNEWLIAMPHSALSGSLGTIQPGFGTVGLKLHAHNCIEKWGLTPNVITVDNYEKTSVKQVIDDINAGRAILTPSKPRGAGTVPTACPPGEESDAALCYPRCGEGFRGVGPVCWKSCPSGFTDTGTDCLKPKSYGRGTGYVVWDEKKCVKENGSCEKNGALWYPKCRPGFHNVGCCVCSPDCPSGTKDVGVSCEKSSYGRSVGKIRSCAQDEEEQAGLCYKKCEAGYTGVGPVCWAN